MGDEEAKNSFEVPSQNCCYTKKRPVYLKTGVFVGFIGSDLFGGR